MKQAASILCCVAFTACASMSVTPTDDPDNDSGIIYYQPKPHLVIAKSTKSGTTQTTSSIIMLPDESRARRVTWSSGLFGSVKPKVTLSDGWMLAGVESEESQGFGDALSTIASAVGFASTEVSPGIYPLRWDSGLGSWIVNWDMSITRAAQ